MFQTSENAHVKHDNIGLVLAYLPSGDMSLHHPAIMTQPSLVTDTESSLHSKGVPIRLSGGQGRWKVSYNISCPPEIDPLLIKSVNADRDGRERRSDGHTLAGGACHRSPHTSEATAMGQQLDPPVVRQTHYWTGSL